MADIEKVWKEEESAKQTRTVINPVRRLTEIDICSESRATIIRLNEEIRRLTIDNNKLLNKK